jgi:hypothetical protein
MTSHAFCFNGLHDKASLIDFCYQLSITVNQVVEYQDESQPKINFSSESAFLLTDGSQYRTDCQLIFLEDTLCTCTSYM